MALANRCVMPLRRLPSRSREGSLSPARSLATLAIVAGAVVGCSSGATTRSGDVADSELDGQRRWDGDVDARACASPPSDVPLVRCAVAPGAAPLALAVCGDLAADNTLTLDSSTGRADLAVQGRARTGSPLHVSGSFTALEGIDAPNTQDVRGDLSTNGDYVVSSPAHVGGDAFVGGKVVADNAVHVMGTLHAAEAPSDNVSAGAIVTGPVRVASPIDCASLPRVSDLVAATVHEPLDAVPRDALREVREPTHLRLGCGRYRWSSIGIDNTLTVDVEGPTVIVVDGDVRVGAPTRIHVAPGATLDLVVGGALRIDNTFDVTGGGAGTWLAVSDGIRIGAPTVLEGRLFAPHADVAADNTFDLRGSAVVGALRVGSPMHVQADAPVDANACVVVP